MPVLRLVVSANDVESDSVRTAAVERNGVSLKVHESASDRVRPAADREAVSVNDALSAVDRVDDARRLMRSLKIKVSAVDRGRDSARNAVSLGTDRSAAWRVMWMDSDAVSVKAVASAAGRTMNKCRTSVSLNVKLSLAVTVTPP
jgi:hypothetical protein